MSISNVLVCVTQQKNCERLIRYAEDLKNTLRCGDLHVLHVAKSNYNFLNNETEGEALEYLFGISKSLGANLAVIKSDEIEKTITQYAGNNNIAHIVIGASRDGKDENHFYEFLKNTLKNVEIHMEN